MNNGLVMFIALIAWIAITIALTAYQQNRAVRINQAAAQEQKILVAELTVLSIAATLAAPHLTKEMTPTEAETTVKMWMPVARNIMTS